MPSWGWGNSVGEMPTDCHPRYAPRPNDKRAKEDRESGSDSFDSVLVSMISDSSLSDTKHQGLPS